MFAYVKNLETSKKSVVKANDIFEIEEVTEKKGDKKKKVWKRSVFSPETEDDFKEKHDYGIIFGDKMVRHYIITLADTKENVASKLRANRPADPNRLSHGSASIPLSEFSLKEERDKLKKDKKQEKSSRTHTKRNVNDDIIQRYKRNREADGCSTVTIENEFKDIEVLHTTQGINKKTSATDEGSSHGSNVQKSCDDKISDKEVDPIKVSTKDMPAPKDKDRSTSNSDSEEVLNLKQERDLTLMECEGLRKENAVLKFQTETYFKGILKKLDKICSGQFASSLKTVKFAVPLEEEFKTDVEVKDDEVYCGLKKKVPMESLENIEDDYENFTKRAVAVAELVLGEKLSQFSVTGESRNGKQLKPIPEKLQKAIKVLLQKMRVLYDKSGKEIVVTQSTMSTFFKKQPTEERRKEDLKNGTYQPKTKKRPAKQDTDADDKKKKHRKKSKKEEECDGKSDSDAKEVDEKMKPKSKKEEECDGKSDSDAKEVHEKMKPLSTSTSDEEDDSKSSDSEMKSNHPDTEKDDNIADVSLSTFLSEDV